MVVVVTQSVFVSQLNNVPPPVVRQVVGVRQAIVPGQVVVPVCTAFPLAPMMHWIPGVSEVAVPWTDTVMVPPFGQMFKPRSMSQTMLVQPPAGISMLVRSAGCGLTGVPVESTTTQLATVKSLVMDSRMLTDKLASPV